MKRKKQIFIIIALIIGIIIVLFVSFKLFSNYKYEHMFDKNKVPGRECFEPDSVLCGVLEGYDYNKLQLSENFKKKYPNKKTLIPEIGKFGLIGSGYDPSTGNIIIFASTTNIFGYANDTIETVYFFDYKTNNDLLDDVTLLKREVYDVITNEILEEEYYNK